MYVQERVFLLFPVRGRAVYIHSLLPLLLSSGGQDPRDHPPSRCARGCRWTARKLLTNRHPMFDTDKHQHFPHRSLPLARPFRGRWSIVSWPWSAVTNSIYLLKFSSVHLAKPWLCGFWRKVTISIDPQTVTVRSMIKITTAVPLVLEYKTCTYED